VWSDAGVEGAGRFLKRLWTFAQAHAGQPQRASVATPSDPALHAARREIHLTLKQANDDYEKIKYNTVVSAGMKILNAIEAIRGDSAEASTIRREGLSILLRVLYPIVPHTTWTLWRDLGFASEVGDLIDAPWPAVAAEALEQDEVELVLQVNGKLRGKLVVAATADRTAIENAAKASPEVAKHSNGAPIKKVVIVPGRLVNVVV
jgi:leucyl-tRNA synthetase